MPISLSSDRVRTLSLVPFGYALLTRFESLRSFSYLVLSSWVPAAWLLAGLGGLPAGSACLAFAAGYLCFISAYEIGYLVNDTWDAGRSETGKRRASFTVDRTYVALFVSTRAVTWGLLGWSFGWIADPVWLAGFAALAAALAIYNLIPTGGLRPAAFLQLTCLRFALPVLGPLPPAELPLLLCAAMLFYVFFRFLSFLEDKRLLEMPERRTRSFGLVQVACLAPLALLLAFATGEAVLAWLLAYMAAIYGIYAYAARS